MTASPERETLQLIARALEEDLGAGDLTTQACVPAGAVAAGQFIARRDVVLAGIELLPAIYDWDPVQNKLARVVAFQSNYESGSRVKAGEVVATARGPARRLLERERVALNFLQHLSGIATLTRRFVDAVEGTGATILDTRKTTPGWRWLEKQAVLAGGGQNHRMGLWDAALIKENHIAAAGGIRAAVEAVKRALQDRSGREPGSSPSLEVEVRSLDELKEALSAGADRLLLDNMTPEQVRACVALARETGSQKDQYAYRPALIEVSGGVTLETVRAYALAGPDFISVGALTHSAPAADISFLFEGIRG